MTHKVKFTHSGKSRAHINHAELREGREVYRHPEGRYIVLEFQGQSGKFREAFWPEDIIKDKLFFVKVAGSECQTESSKNQYVQATP